MSYYKLFFFLFTVSEIVFTIVYYLVRRKADKIMLTGAIIYLGGIITGYIAYRVTAYSRKRKELLDSLP